MKLPKAVKIELDATGLTWTVEGGKRHLHIRLNGNLVGILPKGAKGSEANGRVVKNTVAQIRRYVRKVIEDE